MQCILIQGRRLFGSIALVFFYTDHQDTPEAQCTNTVCPVIGRTAIDVGRIEKFLFFISVFNWLQRITQIRTIFRIQQTVSKIGKIFYNLRR